MPTSYPLAKSLSMLLWICCVTSLSSSPESRAADHQRLEDKGTMRISGLKRPRVEMGAINAVNKLMVPIPAPWPTQFSVKFETNISLGPFEKELVQEIRSVGEQWPVEGFLQYSDGMGQRLSHAAGSRECLKFYNSSLGCTLVFSSSGDMYAQIPTSNPVVTPDACCLDIPGLHVPPANWTLSPHKFFGTRRVRGRMCHGFKYGGGGAGGPQHHYYQDALTRLPCAFSFEGEPLMTWYFNVSSLVEATQESSLFEVPLPCRETRCSPKDAALVNAHPLPASFAAKRDLRAPASSSGMSAIEGARGVGGAGGTGKDGEGSGLSADVRGRPEDWAGSVEAEMGASKGDADAEERFRRVVEDVVQIVKRVEEQTDSVSGGASGQKS